MFAKNILFLGFTTPQNLANTIYKIDPIPAIQTNKFAWSFAKSLKYITNNVFLVSFCPVQNFPICNKIFFKKEKFYENGFIGTQLGFINIIFIKHITRLLNLFLFLPKFIFKNKIKYIFIHGSHSPFLIFSRFAQLFNIKIIIILTDLHSIIIPTDTTLSKILKKIDYYIINYYIQKSNAVICLSEALLVKLNYKKPAIILPGILSSTLYQFERNINYCSSPFIITYAGGLNRMNGIDNLIKAVTQIKHENIVLKLFGKGDLTDDIVSLSKTNKRIVYGGFLDEENLIPQLMSSHLLINPRPSELLFAQMSFPSKLIEYLYMGIPVLTTKIQTIPNDLKNHYHYLQNSSVNEIHSKILQIYNSDFNLYKSSSKNTKNIVETLYSEFATSNKIINLIQSI